MLSLRPHQQRAFAAMQENNAGKIIIPTGGGKTYIMIADAYKHLRDSGPQTIVVVAPRILLANQLCEEFMEHIHHRDVHVCHAHSGETHHFSSTKPEKIALFANTARTAGENCIIFTTYHSLGRVVDSGIDISTIYFDEAHNGTARGFFVAVYATAQIAKRRYYFTATPKTGRGQSLARGMNNTDVYGNTLCNVPAQELIEAGAIEVDADNLKDMFEQLDVFQKPKVLVSAPSSKVLGNMLGQTDILEYFKNKGYDVMHITSKFGAVINGKKVGRELFFQTLQDWGADDHKQFVIFHYSILSEGINVPGLTHTIMLRNLPIIEMAQTIGRVIRVHKDDRADVAAGKIPAGAFHLYKKSEGIVTMPTGYKMGDAIAQRMQNVVNAIFVEGIPPLAFC
jgi:superfamily II DNA or RNA helicase